MSLNRPFGGDGPSWAELARQALSSTTDGYDLLAPRFDHTPFRTPDDLLAAVVALLDPVDRALDLGCGTGAALQALRPIVRQELVGVDLSGGMLEVAREQLAARDGAAVRLVQADALAFDGDGSFDLVVTFGALGHFVPADQPALAASAFRALRPGGRFVFVTGRHPGALHPATWAAWAFNGAMAIRNSVIRPPFVMYYLTFLWPDCATTLEAAGFAVDAIEGALPSPFERGVVVIATRPRTGSASDHDRHL